ncbi:Zn(II)2Cys6 transcription factor domain-containing protein [Aspergillus saccharolyticus JOP 1030-1]|uniref:Zn(2)-C6 fungal-type domain-containing protein n=1 Tax=Aspergillus saccharolyticus JOP 1030-1 TaxID=1450539 RepID=A0A318ZQC2_9EURO|nr:hypothetical protein BP01DRAFT_18174 [Aspergillus saccharolyticus JOP 1030-1]PYH46603.1 hypothetical protein BP01DRAFT_18174 [Aspergillus saccharolyticus JOP 1030-1]
MAKTPAFRPILPAATPLSQIPSAERSGSIKTHRSSACLKCREKRVKCVGSSPCQTCTGLGSACIFEPFKDRRRKSALINAEQSTQRYQELLKQLIGTLMFGDDEQISALKEFVRYHASVESCLELWGSKYQPSLSPSETR